MSNSRALLLFDDRINPPSWNERMQAGEYAVHYSSFDGPSGVAPFCTVFENLLEAETYARDQIAARPRLRCRIYDHQGFIGAPIREFKGCLYKCEGEISSRFRRWGGSVLFFGGLLLTAYDWRYDFELSWPSIIGMRIVIPGLLLLFTEAIIVLHARRIAAGSRRRPLNDTIPFANGN